MKIFFYINLFLLFFSVPNLIYSQNQSNPVTVKGIVIDSLTSETIPYATIRIYDDKQPNVVLKVAATNDNGKFGFTMEEKGEFIMLVEFMGKAKMSKKFAIIDSKTLDLGTILMQDDSKLLGEVVVSAQKPLIKVDIDKISYSVEDDPESKTNTAFDMLKKVPMVTVDGEDNIQLKGSSGYKIYLNGKPSTMIASNPKDVLKSMPASSIKNIEVITDPGAKYDAEGLAGIINITTIQRTSMVGYNAQINTRVNSYGGYGVGGFLTMKKDKLGFTGSYNIYGTKNPLIHATSLTENLENTYYKYLSQNSTQKYNGGGQYGSGEISYEIDTLNLINVGFSLYTGNQKNNQNITTLYQDSIYNAIMEYDQESRTKSSFGSTSINIDYQRTSRKIKDQLLTTSYRFSSTPTEWNSYNSRVGILKVQDLLNDQYSDGKMKEHTFQLDYVTPFGKKHTVEVGAKYIIRLNESNSGYKYRVNDTQDWIVGDYVQNEFKHQQDILSTYLAYTLKLKKFGFKTGMRYESTNVNGRYPLDSKNDFGSDYANLMPSATLTYQLKPMQSLRLGYNMRILRPTITQLNPFVNTTDSTNIRMGNPRLTAVKAHAMSLNYGYFNPKLNVNANLSYDLSGNNIEQIMSFNDGIRKTTYENAGNYKRVGLYTYINWMPITKLRVTSNLSGSYIDIKSNDQYNLKNSGFKVDLYMNLAYSLPNKFRVNLSGGIGSKSISLQTEGGAYSYYTISISKDLMKDKLNINLSGSNIFETNFIFKSKSTTPTMVMNTEYTYRRTWVNLSVSFRFGQMKEQLKKAKRTITNDDIIQSSSSQEGQISQTGS